MFEYKLRLLLIRSCLIGLLRLNRPIRERYANKLFILTGFSGYFPIESCVGNECVCVCVCVYTRACVDMYPCVYSVCMGRMDGRVKNIPIQALAILLG